jgi:hypothetical protein
MSALNKTWLHQLVVVVVTTLILFWCLPELFLNMNTTLINMTGDGIKNYYTMIYHVKHGSGLYFKGFAYPYGDLVTFTDNQPFLAVTLSWFNSLGLPTGKYVIGIFNFFMVTSPVLCAVFLYLIFKHYQVAGWWAMVFSIVIALLSPQFDRIYGHYGMSYCFIFPSIWYCFIRYQQSGFRLIWFWIISLSIFIYSLLHAYLLVICSIFLVFYAIVYLLANLKHWKQHVKPVVAIFSAGIAPLIIFLVFMWWADVYKDRVTVPWGFTLFRSSFSSFFYTDRTTLGLLLPKVIQPSPFIPEGFAYVSFWGVFVFAYIIIRWVIITIKTRKISLTPVVVLNQVNYSVLLITGFLVFMMANIFPFYYAPFNEWSDYLFGLNQFRATGRYAWVCYYIFMVVMSLFFYQKHQQLKAQGKKILATTILLVYSGVILVEAVEIITINWKNVHTKDQDIFFDNNTVDVLKEIHQKPSDFQAILGLPFYGIGSEKFSYLGSEELFFWSIKWSYETGLPLVNFNMPRASTQNCSDILQLLSSPFISKKYPELITDKRPFLLLISDTAKLVSAERDIIQEAKLLYSSPLGYQLYRLNIKDLLRAKAQLLKALNNDYLASKQKMDSTSKLIDFNYSFEDFEYFKGDYLKNDVVVYEGSISVKPDSLFEVSMWGTGSKNFWGSAAFRIEQFDSNNTRVEERFSSENQDIDIVKKWYLLRLQTKKLHPKNTFRITASGHRYQYCNLLIRNPSDTITTIDKRTNWWFVNNRPFKVK